MTSFRGRLPATSDKISFNKGYLPGALSSLPLDNLLPNYFANKRNVFNVIFVKKAWLWTTLAWFAHWVTGLLARTEALSGPTAAVAGKEWRRRMVYRPLARYIAATIAWLLCECGVFVLNAQMSVEIRVILTGLEQTHACAAVTTWFFGPSLSDRVLVFSGAQCVPATLGSASPVHHQAMAAGAVEAAVSGNSEVDAARAQSINDPNHVVDSSHCYSRPDDIYLETAETGSESIKGRKANVEGGRAYWRGGHDISGHSFLLTLSSLLLLTEIAPTLSVLAGGSGGSSPSAGPAGVTPTLSPAMMRMEQLNSARKAATIFTLAIVGIWWWMLLVGFSSNSWQGEHIGKAGIPYADTSVDASH